MVRKLLKQNRISILSVAFLLILCSNVLSQQKLDFLNLELSSEDKETLTTSIKNLTENMRREKWSEVYDLFLNDPVKGRTKEEFIQEMEENLQNPNLNRRIIGFEPKSFLVFDDEKMREKVNVSGCILVLVKGEKYTYWGRVEAARNGTKKWFFTSLPMVNPNSSSGGPKPCCQ